MVRIGEMATRNERPLQDVKISGEPSMTLTAGIGKGRTSLAI